MGDAVIEREDCSEFSIESSDPSPEELEEWVSACEIVASILGQLPDDGKADLLEVLQVMGGSQEEMDAGGDTIREMLLPLVGTIVPAVPKQEGRDDRVQKWSEWVGQKVREFRKLAQMTQSELSEKSGLPQSHISRIENGEISPTRATIERIAAAFGRGIEDFDPSH